MKMQCTYTVEYYLAVKKSEIHRKVDGTGIKHSKLSNPENLYVFYYLQMLTFEISVCMFHMKESQWLDIWKGTRWEGKFLQEKRNGVLCCKK